MNDTPEEIEVESRAAETAACADKLNPTTIPLSDVEPGNTVRWSTLGLTTTVRVATITFPSNGNSRIFDWDGQVYYPPEQVGLVEP